MPKGRVFAMLSKMLQYEKKIHKPKPRDNVAFQGQCIHISVANAGSVCYRTSSINRFAAVNNLTEFNSIMIHHIVH